MTATATSTTTKVNDHDSNDHWPQKISNQQPKQPEQPQQPQSTTATATINDRNSPSHNQQLQQSQSKMRRPQSTAATATTAATNWKSPWLQEPPQEPTTQNFFAVVALSLSLSFDRTFDRCCGWLAAAFTVQCLGCCWHFQALLLALLPQPTVNCHFWFVIFCLCCWQRASCWRCRRHCHRFILQLVGTGSTWYW